MIITNDTINIT